MLDAEITLLFATDNPGKIGGIIHVAHITRKMNLLVTAPEISPRFRESQANLGRIERLNLERTFASADHQVPAGETLDLLGA